jgi:hypothetical protein
MSSDNTNISLKGSDGKYRDFQHSASDGKVYETTQPVLGRNSPTEAGSATTVAGAIDLAKSITNNSDGKVHLS